MQTHMLSQSSSPARGSPQPDKGSMRNRRMLPGRVTWISGKAALLLFALFTLGCTSSSLRVSGKGVLAELAVPIAEWSARIHQKWFCPKGHYMEERTVKLDKRDGVANVELQYDCMLLLR